MGITQLLPLASILVLFPKGDKATGKQKQNYPRPLFYFCVQLPMVTLQRYRLVSYKQRRIFGPRAKVYFRWKFVNVGPITVKVNFSQPIKWICSRQSHSFTIRWTDCFIYERFSQGMKMNICPWSFEKRQSTYQPPEGVYLLNTIPGADE